MAPRHVIVDGSNLATEGRNLPSLAQLDQAVREFIAENPTDDVTVVVDASFGHRIDPSEVAAFEEAEAAGEVVSPPAGAIGRGDAFLLRIAEKTGATVLSNDSFQEFHGEHTWLFDKGRLVGGKPVPGVGWIFMDRTPVRGAKSREVTKEAKRKKRTEVDVAPKAPSGGGRSQAAAKADKGDAKPDKADGKGRPKAVDRAIARATEEVTDAKGGSKRRRRIAAPPSEPVNQPLAFITFIAAHPLGSEVVGSVLEYSSHGAFIEADGARCYLPLSAMADPPPRRARDGVTKGAQVSFVVQAFDPPRRGIELALPGFAKIAGGPRPETVEAEISAVATPVPRRRRAPQPAEPTTTEPPADGTPSRRGRTRKAAVEKVAVEPVEPVEAPASGRRRRTKGDEAAAPPAVHAVAAMEAPAPTPARSRKAAAPDGAEAPPAKATRTRKAATPTGDAAAPVKATRARKAAAPAGDAAAPVKATRARKAAAPAGDAAAPVKATRARKAAAATGGEASAPVKATRARKAAAATGGEASAPVKATRARKAPASKKSAPVVDAPAKRATRKPSPK